MPTTFVARQKGAFTSLIQSTSLGSYTLEAQPPITIRDRYFDTDDGELLRRGMCLLVRTIDGESTAHLIGIEDAESNRNWVGSLLKESLDPPLRTLASAFELPRGELQDTLLEYIEGDRLKPLLQLRQHRTPRDVRTNDREIAWLSFDVVVFEDPVNPVISNEALLAISDEGTAKDVTMISGLFKEVGLDVEPRSRFERGVLRNARTLEESILLLPDERDVLETIASSGAETERESASVILMDSKGFRDMTISDATGFKTPTVRRLRHAFRQSRMELFEYLLEPGSPDASQAPAPTVRSRDKEERGVFSEADDEVGAQEKASLEKMETYEDMDSLLEAFRPVKTNTPRFHESESMDDEAETSSQAGSSGTQEHATKVAASRLRAELDRLDRHALAVRASNADLDTVADILYSAHRFLVFLDWFQPLISSDDHTTLASPLEQTIHRAERVLDHCSAAESRDTEELRRQCDRARETLHAWLEGSESTTWRGVANRLILQLETLGPSEEERPAPGRLLGSTLQNRSEKVRTYAEGLDSKEASPFDLYRLAVGVSGLRIAIEEAGLGRGQSVASLRERLRQIETTLARVRHAHVRAELTGETTFLSKAPDAESVQVAIDALRGNELQEELARVTRRM